MQGRRVDFNDISDLIDLKPGDYCMNPHGIWFAVTPNGHLGDLSNHDVTDNPDGTITVSPSILVSSREGGRDIELWHGYIKNGVWSEC